MWYRLAIKDCLFDGIQPERYLQRETEPNKYEKVEKWYEFAQKFVSQDILQDLYDENQLNLPYCAIVEQVDKPSKEWLDLQYNAWVEVVNEDKKEVEAYPRWFNEYYPICSQQNLKNVSAV